MDEEKRAATRKAKKQAVVRNLDNKQWGLAAELVNVLQPFTVATTFLSAQNNISVSCVQLDGSPSSQLEDNWKRLSGTKGVQRAHAK